MPKPRQQTKLETYRKKVLASAEVKAMDVDDPEDISIFIQPAFVDTEQQAKLKKLTGASTKV